MSVSPVPIIRVTAAELRRIFNEEGCVERAQTGELVAVIVHSGTPNPEIGLPPGSRSQLVSYRTAGGEELARAHRYLLPDGKIGASGKPDPKRVFRDGVLYRLKKSGTPVALKAGARDEQVIA